MTSIKHDEQTAEQRVEPTVESIREPAAAAEQGLDVTVEVIDEPAVEQGLEMTVESTDEPAAEQGGEVTFESIREPAAAAEQGLDVTVESMDEPAADPGVVVAVEPRGESMAEVDSNYMDSDKSTSPPKPHRLTRKERLKRRKRIALRKMMLSFDEPERQPVYRRLLLPPNDSDMSGEDEEAALQHTAIQKNSRKRKRNVDGWKRNAVVVIIQCICSAPITH